MKMDVLKNVWCRKCRVHHRVSRPGLGFRSGWYLGLTPGFVRCKGFTITCQLVRTTRGLRWRL